MKMKYNKSISSTFNIVSNNILRSVYITLQIILYLSFMSLDIINDEQYMISNILKFTSIILCFLYVCITQKIRQNKKDAYILMVALFFTVISDWFILMKNSISLGLVTFIVVQYMYLLRIHLYRKINLVLMPIIRNIIISFFIIFLIRKVSIEAEIVQILSLVILYFVAFIFNIIDISILCYKLRRKELYFFLLGLVLFILCDINVGLFNLTSFIVVNDMYYRKLYSFVFLGMWFFYLPSQVVLSVSDLSFDNKIERFKSIR